MTESGPARQLWVCWTKPTRLPVDDSVLLSFLSPSIDEELHTEHHGIVIQAREVSLSVRTSARELYVALVAKISTGVCSNGLTLRESLARPGESSLWWYHRVAFKDCESDPVFEWIIALLTIRKVAEQYGLKVVVLVGAPHQLAQALKDQFAVEEFQSKRPGRSAKIWVRGLADRYRYAATALRNLRAIRRRTAAPHRSLDVVFSGFFDWSVSWDDRAQSFADRYYKQLPNELKRRNAAVGWFAWFDPNAEPGKEWRSPDDVLETIVGSEDVILLQSFLRPWEILRALLEFHPSLTFLRLRRRQAFKGLFLADGLDFYPLFSDQLLRGFLDANLPHHRLVAVATERVCRRYRPRIALSFLEHFPYSRAHYEGVRRSGIGAKCFAVQHASYSHEKTFLLLHPSVEFDGEPDGCAVPHPDYVCAMGTLARELFLECGYGEEQVLLTGSPRYDQVTAQGFDSARNGNRKLKNERQEINLLMVSGLDVRVELQMVDAVCAATRHLSNFNLLLRNHPFSRVEQSPEFEQYKDRIKISSNSLNEDLSQADIILFTYSTVAEEALLRGKPVWQWLPLGFNGSALAEVAQIPQFGLVARLRESLLKFQSNPGDFVPALALREFALERLFYRGDGGAAQRVSLACLNHLSQTASQEAVQ